jgi:flagellar basal-body rod protein FlgB
VIPLSRIMFDTTMAVLEKGLDGTAARQRATASNLANIETPGYRPQAVSFEDDLRRALAEERAITPGGSREGQSAGMASPVERVTPITEDGDVNPVRLDNNAVNIESEVATLSKNSLQHAAMLRLMSKKIEMMRAVLK